MDLSADSSYVVRQHAIEGVIVVALLIFSSNWSILAYSIGCLQRPPRIRENAAATIATFLRLRFLKSRDRFQAGSLET